jgi:DNA-binding MarR family transcriptional regulator
MVNIPSPILSRGKRTWTNTAVSADPQTVKPQNEMTAEAGFRALIRVSGLLDRVMQPYFGRFGISRSQWGVLRILQRSERDDSSGLRLVDLGERLLVRPPSVTGLVSRLERLGYVVRNSSTDDLRGREVHLTDAGRDLLARVLQSLGAQIAAVMQTLNLREQKQLLALLERLGAHLQDMAEGRADAGTC